MMNLYLNTSLILYLDHLIGSRFVPDPMFPEGADPVAPLMPNGTTTTSPEQMGIS